MKFPIKIISLNSMPKHLYTKRDPEIKKRTLELYKQGLTMREVGKIVKKSRQWVCDTIHELGVDRGGQIRDNKGRRR